MAEDAESMTPYQYAYNLPNMRNDPTGAQVPMAHEVVDLEKVAHYEEERERNLMYSQYATRAYQGKLQEMVDANNDVEQQAYDQMDYDEALYNAGVYNADGSLNTTNTFANSRGSSGPTPLESAEMSKAAYGDYTGSLGRYVQVHENIKDVAWNDETSGFKSSLFITFDENGTPSYVYATAGTDDWSDVFNDVEQLAGFGAQYQISVSNARLISNYVGENSLTFTGHSLGGGLAILNSIATGRDATVFNPAAVSGWTLRNDAGLGIRDRDKTFSGQINTYIMQGDLLNPIQYLIGMPAQGNHIYVPPVSEWRLPFSQHGIDNFIKAFQK